MIAHGQPTHEKQYVRNSENCIIGKHCAKQFSAFFSLYFRASSYRIARMTPTPYGKFFELTFLDIR